MKFSKSVGSILLAPVFLVACGGGGANENGQGAAPSTPLGWNTNDAGNYFPIIQDSAWIYWETNNSNSPTKKTHHVETKVAGLQVSGALSEVKIRERVSVDSVATEYTLQKSGNGIIAPVQVASWANQHDMVLDINFSAKQGDAWQTFKKTGLVFHYDIDGDGKRELADIEQSASFDGYENIVTEAGSFEHAVKITTHTKYTTHLSKSGTAFSSISTRVRWFAGGIGLVKQVNTDDVGLPSEDVSTRELKAYDINGKNAGFKFPQILLDDIGTNNSDYEQVLAQPAIASNGHEYMLAATREADAYPYKQSISVARLGGDFSSLGQTTIECSWGCGQAALIFGAGKYVVAYNSSYNVLFQRFQSDGQVIESAGVPLADRGSAYTIRRRNPVMAFDGNNYLIVYKLESDVPGADERSTGIYGTIISPDGKIVKSDILIRPTNSMVQSYSVAYGAGAYLVTFASGERSPGRCDMGCEDVLGVRISMDGNVLDSNPIAISTAPDMQINPKVVFDGSNFVVAWQDRRNYQSLPTNFLPLIMDIYATRVSPQGTLMDGDATTGAIAIESNQAPKQPPALISVKQGVVLAWPAGPYSNEINGAGIYVKPVGIDGQLKAGQRYFVSSEPRDNDSRLGMFYSGAALAVIKDDLVAAWVDNSVSRLDQRHKRIIGARANMASLSFSK
ncbi:hypothetical protein FNU76_17630 [Chitinimonas arctica]|uniref:Uncharacterized protein n=1 Tax=Chitinimonas arctica TaxID=2594795 RepID=A0A516SIN6_9NEIS|nr:hypothetical protein [Chitinimonas arctica]QDQ28019.1 hypothetical protein FNU76_17630 [Chitinimonas arctica]